MVRGLYWVLAHRGFSFSHTRTGSTVRSIHRRHRSRTHRPRRRSRHSCRILSRHIWRHPHSNHRIHRFNHIRRLKRWPWRRTRRRTSRTSRGSRSDFSRIFHRHHLSRRRLDRRRHNPINALLLYRSIMNAFSCVVFSGTWSSTIRSSGFLLSTIGCRWWASFSADSSLLWRSA